MEIRDRTVLILGGSGLVGMAVARALAPHRPAALVISALREAEARVALDELRADAAVPAEVRLEAEWGDIFYPEPLKDRTRGEVLADPEARGMLLDDLLGEMTEDVVRRSTLASILYRHRPEVVVDCVNTATAFAYQNVFESAARLRAEAHRGDVAPESVERHLATLYLPQLIRHVQLALESMRQAETRLYLKIGTAGTGGMGLNIPFTHSEERPSRTLLSKSGLAGAHTLLLYLMARTPGAPAVKEIKPTAAISWRRIGFGEVRRAGRPIRRYDATRPLPLGEAFAPDHPAAYEAVGDHLQGVYLDAGENGCFSLGEFETLTALGLMEYITPEEIAVDVVREIQGHATGKDVVAALDAATAGPTYRAGVLRGVALERMADLEAEHGVHAVAYEMLGPPRLSKLLFEADILRRLFDDLAAAAGLDPDETAARAEALVAGDRDLRSRILSIGLPILLADGERILRGPDVKVAPESDGEPNLRWLCENGWVDLRPANWHRWRDRTAALAAELTGPGADHGSRADLEPRDHRRRLRPGRLAAWVFRYEDRGERIKR